MSTSGTFAFNPNLGEITLYAFHIAGVRPTAITQEHLFSARMAANMINSRWCAQGVNLWAVDLQTVPLIQGQSTYSVLANTVAMLDGYVVTNTDFPTNNRILLPISRSEYATYPNPQQQGFPTVYWFDRLLSPTVTLWQVPDGNQASFNYYRMLQIQDSVLQGATQVQIPYYALEAYAFALAARLAIIWNPTLATALKGMADEAYNIFADQNVETAQFFVSPVISSYWRT